MKVYGKVENALVMTKKAEQGKKDPSKTYFYVGIVKDDELGEISATEEVYNAVERGCFYNFGTCYNSDFDMFQLEKSFPVGIAPVMPPTPEKADTSAPVDAETSEPETEGPAADKKKDAGSAKK